VRDTTAFKRILSIPGAAVDSVAFEGTSLVIGLRRLSRKHTCQCGQKTNARYDISRRRWRHLDFGVMKVFLEADIARVDCRRCKRVLTETVPWARPGARHTSDFEDMVAWLAQRCDMTTIATLMRCSWAAVHDIAGRVVALHVDTDRLDKLYRIGVDEVSYKRGHRYLTIVADHDTGRVVWVAKGKRGAAIEGFFDALGEERAQQIEAISMDLGTIFHEAAKRRIPDATVCFDPFHVMQIVGRALDAVDRRTGDASLLSPAWKGTRLAIRTASEDLNVEQREVIRQIKRERHRLWRAWELKEHLRALHKSVGKDQARGYLKWWITSAKLSRIAEFRAVAKQVQRKLRADHRGCRARPLERPS
jgi:transposase